jgi:formate-dependent nitrite reductase membrane component NrfD
MKITITEHQFAVIARRDQEAKQAAAAAQATAQALGDVLTAVAGVDLAKYNGFHLGRADGSCYLELNESAQE